MEHTLSIKKESFTYISLFSGVGGFEFALNRLGGRCLMASDIDVYANKSYKALFGEETVGDITKINERNIPDHDILVGGFPCQPFSNSGRQLGLREERGLLFFEIVRIAKYKQPKALLLENVKGLINNDSGKTMTILLKTLNDIGYTVDMEVMNSKFFDVPHNRERVYIVAIRNDLVHTKGKWNISGNTIMAKRKKSLQDVIETLNFPYPKQENVCQDLSFILEDGLEEKWYLKDGKVQELLHEITIHNLVPNSIAPHPFSKKMEFKGGGGYKTPICPCLLATDYKAPKTILVLKQGIQLREDGLYDKTDFRIRKLTPKESVRLQGFPKGTYELLVSEGLSNTQIYKQFGNAVTVNVVEAVGEQLLKYIREGIK